MTARMAVLAFTVASCSGPARPPSPAPPDDGSPPELAASAAGLRAGEGASYRMTLAGIDIGEAAFAVGEPGELDGRGALVVSSRATAIGLAAILRKIGADGATTMDAVTGLPIHADGVLHWAAADFRGDLDYAGPVVEGAWYEGENLIESVYRDTGGAPVHNAHSAMAAVRGWDGTPGEQRSLHLHGAINIWRVTLTWIGDDTIGGTRGNQAAVRVDGECRLDDAPSWTIRFSVWLSDDDDRVPLRMTARVRFLAATFDLTDYRPPDPR